MSETRILTAAQMRWADAQTIRSGVSASILMDRAGKALATAIIEKMPDYGRIVIVAGSGHNGGDGFAAAHYLRLRRLPVTIVTLVPVAELNIVCKTYADRARAAGAKIRQANSDDGIAELNRWLLRAVLVVDAIFGIGLNRAVSPFVLKVIQRINQTDRPVLSVDIASGLCADTGAVLGAAVQADYTLPIVASKWGHWLAEGRDYTGVLLNIADIGVSEAIVKQSWQHSCADGQDDFCVRSTCLIHERFLVQAWPKRSRLTHKGSYGRVAVFGASVGFTGAPQLAALGAYAAGAGLVNLICPDDVWPVVAAANLEVMCEPQSAVDWQKIDGKLVDGKRADGKRIDGKQIDGKQIDGKQIDGKKTDGHIDALVAGPGWGMQQGPLLQRLLASNKALLLDADALNMIAADAALQQQLCERDEHQAAITVITPHPGEAARLLGRCNDDVQRCRKECVLALTTRYRCWVVLKGAETLIASPAGDIYLNPFGSARLAIAGSGDVLAGMIGAQLARAAASDADLGLLISAAVALHGKAGECSGWYLAGELAKQVADLRQYIEQTGSVKSLI